MTELKVGDKAPDFCLPNSDEKEICLSEFRGRWVILYFYPRDNTSGCTKEALDFTTHIKEFIDNGAVVIGVSPDSPRSHQRFILRHNLKVELLSDTEKTVLKMYGAWGKKKRYGREVEGVIRTTYLIDDKGVIRHIWRNVKVKGHVEEVLERLKELKKSSL